MNDQLIIQNDICFRTIENACVGSPTFCEFIKDLNDTLSHGYLKKALWPRDFEESEYYLVADNSTFLKMAQTFFNNVIVIRLRYKDHEVEFTKLDVRTTTTDKIANFGGTFGIWAELTGCSLLGLINLLILSFKLLFRKK